MKAFDTDELWGPMINYECNEFNIKRYVCKILKNDEKYEEGSALRLLRLDIFFKVHPSIFLAVVEGEMGRDEFMRKRGRSD